MGKLTFDPLLQAILVASLSPIIIHFQTSPHEVFVSLLGPLLVPEHYPSTEMSSPLSPHLLSPVSSAPFELIYFEGRAVKTTLSNIQGVDSLASDQRWSSQCVFSIDVGRHVKQGVEAVRALPHLRVERVQLTSGGRSSYPMPTWSSSTENTLRRNPPPRSTHYEPFCSHSRASRHHTPYSSPTRAPTAPQRSPSQHASTSTPQGSPHARKRLFSLILFLHLPLH